MYDTDYPNYIRVLDLAAYEYLASFVTRHCLLRLSGLP